MDKYGQHPSTHVSLYRGSLNFARAAEIILNSGEKIPADVFGFLVSHSLELALKAFLISTGFDDDRLRKQIGHSLIEAWKMSAQHGLSLETDPPDWCQTLNSAHDTPYHFRYARTNTGLVTPAPKKAVSGLNNVLEMVGDAIGLDKNGNFV